MSIDDEYIRDSSSIRERERVTSILMDTYLDYPNDHHIGNHLL
jgi:hypothetical protein